ncbi:transcriptional regulator, TetR family [Hyphomicrobium denitrificans ATCC 51888]|uniref:Transcriptional regulator, TetR family n=1 Tax=Hyphomicrobium denitrificans (strain ATCC 51888 / DSM 1869 / NCIMB 11706 / TK 0415) TaxID=582899 RepID=D8JTQ6_HYPDA|nr:TetR/AcrR family transcriptional regulator [Hyphomicrobium denitrificans]ADJ22618.1 transcriptional regulator, TetR family [Hyphomicrobium denitrificans ATCC 51888]
MSLAHRRKKRPVEVRGQLLDVAARLCAEVGIANATLDAISQRAGVSKGGLLHHFPTKQALIVALVDKLLDDLLESIESYIAKDPDPVGRFTRAYLLTCLEGQNNADAEHWNTLGIMLATETAMRTRWVKWFSKQMRQHGNSDDTIGCLIVRMAADGFWFSKTVGITSVPSRQKNEFVEQLDRMTRSGSDRLRVHAQRRSR